MFSFGAIPPSYRSFMVGVHDLALSPQLGDVSEKNSKS